MHSDSIAVTAAPLNDITPLSRSRWEWRVFEPHPGSFIPALRPLGAIETGSHEICILSVATPHNVKIRVGLLDVRRLVETTPDGLELWEVALEAAFPVDARKLDILWEIWDIKPQVPGRLSYTHRQFLREVVGVVPSLRVVRLVKRRTRFTVDDCRAEAATVSTVFGRLDTLAIEHENRDHLLTVVQSLGKSVPHTANYPAALKRLVGMTTSSWDASSGRSATGF